YHHCRVGTIWRQRAQDGQHKILIAVRSGFRGSFEITAGGKRHRIWGGPARSSVVPKITVTSKELLAALPSPPRPTGPSTRPPAKAAPVPSVPSTPTPAVPSVRLPATNGAPTPTPTPKVPPAQPPAKTVVPPTSKPTPPPPATKLPSPKEAPN